MALLNRQDPSDDHSQDMIHVGPGSAHDHVNSEGR